MEYTLTVVTQEREVHVIASPAVTWRKTERSAAWRPGGEGLAAYPSGMEQSAPMCAHPPLRPCAPHSSAAFACLPCAQRNHLVKGYMVPLLKPEVTF